MKGKVKCIKASGRNLNSNNCLGLFCCLFAMDLEIFIINLLFMSFMFA